MTSLVRNKILNYRAQIGDEEHPARSCRDIQLDHPNSPSGLYLFCLLVGLVELYVCSLNLKSSDLKIQQQRRRR